MKSEFLLAFNAICSDRNLPREVVLEAIRTALVSAYRRNVAVPPTQNVTAQIDPETGKARVFIEQLVVEQVTNPQVEISLERARAIDPSVNLGDALMVESTPGDFGRIAAQTARQVILQRIREAEREAQYAHFVEQEGELVYGTVQSVTPQQVTLHLERTEAVLPRKEMVPGERYMLHDRIRAYVIEVKKTGRGPQIVVSRSHKKMLQRLLELEVPEISNGTVEIKAIAREAGSRSKVAVMARQEGIDPVGACVGMRGMRIQSIVKELGGEKVDVIEWSPDPVTYIAKALGPAKVLSVLMEDDPVEGRTANVVVPDDQLSLAIGKAGQNARLAAKLTTWRIDIQGVSEAAEWALKQVNEDAAVLPALGPVAELLPAMSAALRRHEQEGLPYNAEELVMMRRVIEGVRGYYITTRNAQRARLVMEEMARRSALEQARSARQAEIQRARASIPLAAYQVALSEIGLSARVLNHLERSGLSNVGQLMESLAEGDEGLLKLDGIGPKALGEIREALDRFALPVPPEAEPQPVIEELPAVIEELPAIIEEAPPEALPVAVELPAVEPVPAIAVETAPVVEEVPAAEVVEVTAPVEPQPPAVEPAAAPAAVTTPLESVPLVSAAGIAEVIWEDWDEEKDEGVELLGKKKPAPRKVRRRLIYDEDRGETLAIRRHRRAGDEWEDEL